MRIRANKPAKPTHTVTGDQTRLLFDLRKRLNIFVLYCSGVTEGRTKERGRGREGRTVGLEVRHVHHGELKY